MTEPSVDPVASAAAVLAADRDARLAAAQHDLDALLRKHRVTLVPIIATVDPEDDESVRVVPGLRLVALA